MKTICIGGETVAPSKIVCVGRNYLEHIRELGNTPLDSLSLELEIDGQLRQAGGYALMMHKPDAILAGIQAFMSLDDGDIVMTGTPEGVGPVGKGERFVGRIKSGDTILVEQSWTAE